MPGSLHRAARIEELETQEGEIMYDSRLLSPAVLETVSHEPRSPSSDHIVILMIFVMCL